jgi:hypothetical protein
MLARAKAKASVRDQLKILPLELANLRISDEFVLTVVFLIPQIRDKVLLTYQNTVTTFLNKTFQFTQTNA